MLCLSIHYLSIHYLSIHYLSIHYLSIHYLFIHYLSILCLSVYLYSVCLSILCLSIHISVRPYTVPTPAFKIQSRSHRIIGPTSTIAHLPCHSFVCLKEKGKKGYPKHVREDKDGWMDEMRWFGFFLFF